MMRSSCFTAQAAAVAVAASVLSAYRSPYQSSSLQNVTGERSLQLLVKLETRNVVENYD